MVLGLGDGGGGGEGGGGGDVNMKSKTIKMNWSYCMDGLKGKEAISPVG